MITLHSVYRSYQGRQILRDLDIEFRNGDITCLLGPNGAGKTTMLRMMGGELHADRGEVLVDGKPHIKLADPCRSVSFVTDERAAHPSRSARGHLTWVAQACGRNTKLVSKTLEEVGLAHVARKRVGTFSLGMRQRLSIATSMIADSHNMICDEPVNGLDVDGVIWARSVFRQAAAAGKCVVMSTHLLSEVERIADRIVIIGDGEIRFDGTVAEIVQGFDSLEDAYVETTTRV